ncbi:sugar ABC transporter ATP-binding protein [Alkalihalobacillus hwajinpoensis]|uniref:sugar ABC transporter ATP-binding protein n=1 Tax=Guptibacillus hwajinpoensis TaxID=208199 RepID=UPI0018833E05|nr:sugar ABC transporter ATP-binding protein [Pseudalkalibacillus hwajinpoensis]MBF0706036.1 sugar ABC transporter ATP-binding protein [Pseudalkalibacillus hwajinpoensis]
MGEDTFILQMKGVCKYFPGVVALDHVSLNIKKGEVHALMGENGAGKSTLMKILSGVYSPDEGEIILNGKITQISNPKDALNSGISMIHQELEAIPEMTVAENIFIGREPSYKFLGVVKSRELNQRTTKLFDEIGLSINPKAKLSTLSVAEMQMIEIVKAVSFNSQIVVMDEPTSAITDREVEKLFGIIKMLKEKGVSIIYISHKMSEIFQIADQITVLRDGGFVDSRNASELTNQKLISLMVGRDIKDMFIKEKIEIGGPMLEIKNFRRKGSKQAVNLKVNQGEVLGISGLMGAGRTELMEAIFGIGEIVEGELFLRKKPVKIKSSMDAIKNGISFVTEDRKLYGLNLKGSVKENISLVNFDNITYLNQVINKTKEKSIVNEQINSLNIRIANQQQVVGTLSGGNQQKVVLAKWLLREPDVLILDEPTRGIDVGAKDEIYKIITELAKSGKAVIMISSEMPELLGMSDRLVVMYNDEITGEFERDEFDQESILSCATGYKKGGRVC